MHTETYRFGISCHRFVVVIFVFQVVFLGTKVINARLFVANGVADNFRDARIQLVVRESGAVCLNGANLVRDESVDCAGVPLPSLLVIV